MPQPAKVVARFVDGRVLKGHTMNFDPSRPTFQLGLLDDSPGAEPTLVQVAGLKAVFFVKDFAGVPEYSEKKEFNTVSTGRRLRVRFHDGEELVGTSVTYDAKRQGFFLFPADRFSNNEKVFVVAAAVADITRAE
jgi:small nuclear ribonucleoprotein (snRNP)-like protein